MLDNEISENMKQHIRDEYKFTLELVPPGCYRRNAAEVAIRNFRAHFLSVLAVGRHSRQLPRQSLGQIIATKGDNTLIAPVKCNTDGVSLCTFVWTIRLQ